MYKLIAIDVDDTLLNDDIIVTEGTKKALERAIQAGVTVTLATGRMYASARKIAEQVELNVPIITYQGALVKTLLDGQILYERTVPADAARKVLQYANEHQLHLQLYVDDVLYGTEDNARIQAYSKLSNIPYEIEPDFEKLIHKPNHKMLIIDEPEVLDHHIVILQEMFGDQLHITKSKAHYLEFMHKEGTKGHALQYLASHIGCTMDQTIAIGDAWNDREMVQAAGLGVAMGNAVPMLKEIADYITLSNNEDGVKHVIDKFVFNEE